MRRVRRAIDSIASAIDLADHEIVAIVGLAMLGVGLAMWLGPGPGLAVPGALLVAIAVGFALRAR